ncbi:MAG TPA: S49 family peptidase [Rhodocyclaceae bacterium]|jgi:protease-4|nr:S49 family peptidase [Betaproteobacteria bacterium]HMU99465.1 S49 family peptidase [Rhodocyclaceae bacterium]HMV20793.1 S49 family peptidase [Rhodocyclaceae bacterium]HNE42545.1 S49 family peptidase [Rhodocyclaceae bacterium]HNM22019.1 S49 family peptidase [Rhodocyclaceae bacterium]
MTDLPGNEQPQWERKTLEKLAFAALEEQRLRRRWGIFFKTLGFIYVLVVLVAFVDWGEDAAHQERHTALVHLNGVIEPRGEASAEKLIAALQSAFEEKHAAGIVLRINSPGGSPVQAGMVNDEIRRLRAKYPDKPLYAVVEDLCASGGYYVAAAADKIYVNKASLVGSIGVIMEGFGFTGTMDKVGVERRLLTAGVNKGFLDPFSPQDPGQKAHAQGLLDDIHKQFIDVVRAGRGKRLKETPEMFSGLVWTGAQSVELGLADDFGSVESVARDVVKAEKLFEYTVKDNIAERVAKRLGAGAMSSFWDGLFTRASGVSLR